jgi:uncharacterized membrane protein
MRIIFVSVGLIGILLFSAPTIGLLVKLPSGGQQFSELYLLGPDHQAENYPYDIAVGQLHSVYVGVGNQLKSSAYYVLYVKFGNQFDQIPNSALGTPSSLQPLYEYSFTIQPSKNWENLMTFSVSNATISNNNSQIRTLQINNVLFDLNKPAIWDSNSASFKYNLLVELWMYNTQSSQIEYNNRYVNLPLNLTNNSDSR